MTDHEENAIREMSGDVRELSQKISGLASDLRDHITRDDVAWQKVEKHDTALWPVVNDVKALKDWKEQIQDRAKFVERSLVGGALKKAGEMLIMGAVVWAAMFFSRFNGKQDTSSSSTTVVVPASPAGMK